MISNVYRGELLKKEADKISVEQAMPGFDYGEPSMEFFLGEEVSEHPNWDRVKVGCFVEVLYKAGTDKKKENIASSVQFVSPAGKDTVVNGEIRFVARRNEIYFITLSVLNKEGVGDHNNTVIITAMDNTLEGITSARLAPLNKISVVTRGIQTMSLPPQMPAHVVLPFVNSKQE